MRIRWNGINGLPTELLCNIFRLVIDPSTSGRDRCRLILVCRQWREYVEGSALLWADISALDGPHSVRRSLEKSKGAMINLHYPAYGAAGEDLEWFLTEASLHIARWRSVDVKGDTSLRAWEFVSTPLITTQAPSLQTLDLRIPFDDHPESNITLFGGAPAPPTLKHLTVHWIPIAFEPLSLSGLLSLDLTEVPTISTPQLLEILRGSPCLETLNLDDNRSLEGIGSQSSTAQPIELPNLVSISFIWMNAGGTNSILSNIRIPNRHRVLIYGTITEDNIASVLITSTITHILHTTIPIADLPSSEIRVEVDLADTCTIEFRGMELTLMVDGEDEIQEMLAWLAGGLGAEAANYPVRLILERLGLDPLHLVAVPPPLVVKHLTISDFGSGSLSESLCTAMARPPDLMSSGWLLAQMETFSIVFETIESQKQLTSMLRSRYQGASLTGDTEFRCPMSLRSVELRGQPRTDGLVEEIRGILGEVDVFWAD